MQREWSEHMNKHPIVTTIVIIAFGLMSRVAAHDGPAAEDVEPVVAEARAIVDAYKEFGWFSGSVLLAKAGRPIYQTSVGLANRENQTPNGLDTK